VSEFDKTTNSGREPVNPVNAGVPDPEKLPDGQHKDHWILPDEDRAKGFIRPVRTEYRHEKCGSRTTMPIKIAETYAVNPAYYGSTFCGACGGYSPVGVNGEFVWLDGSKVGS
jgi:hypothetical protein